MRYITIPEPVETVLPTGQTVMYGMEAHHANEVWAAEVWRVEPGAFEVLLALREKFGEVPEPGTVVGLTDAEYEKYAPVYMMAGKTLAPWFQATALALMAPVARATTKDPREDKKESPKLPSRSSRQNRAPSKPDAADSEG